VRVAMVSKHRKGITSDDTEPSTAAIARHTRRVCMHVSALGGLGRTGKVASDGIVSEVFWSWRWWGACRSHVGGAW